MRCFLPTLLLTSLVSLTLVSAEESPELADKAINELVGLLGDSTYSTRQDALGALLEKARTERDAVVDAALDAYIVTEDPEVRFQLKEILVKAMGTKIYSERPGFLGIQMEKVFFEKGDEAVPAIAVMRVVENTAATKVGLKVGDNIIQVDHLKIESDTLTTDFAGYVGALTTGTEINLKIIRGDEELEVNPVLGARPQSAVSVAQMASPKERFRSWLSSEISKRKAALEN